MVFTYISYSKILNNLLAFNWFSLSDMSLISIIRVRFVYLWVQFINYLECLAQSGGLFKFGQEGKIIRVITVQGCTFLAHSLLIAIYL